LITQNHRYVWKSRERLRMDNPQQSIDHHS
jgi:hypothetical protein